ncbi:MAG: acyl-CoA dehydrogenase, partial [Ideonella sp.]|nr:acyl-CoA dehydrogenase [Ideonella sp.]
MSTVRARDPLLRQRIARCGTLGLQMLHFNALRVLAVEASQPQPRLRSPCKYTPGRTGTAISGGWVDVLGEVADIADGDRAGQRLQSLWLASR